MTNFDDLDDMTDEDVEEIEPPEIDDYEAWEESRLCDLVQERDAKERGEEYDGPRND